MSDFAFPPPAPPSVAVAATDKRFPVHRIYCVGLNYADHVREMGNDPQRAPPIFFSKPADAAGNDLTRRDLQHAAKQRGQPWDAAKGFDCSAPIAAIRPAALGQVSRGRIWLSVNGELRQESDLSQMLWDASHIIAELSTLYLLMPGDLIC